MGKAQFGLERDLVFRDARRRAALVFQLNIALSLTIALVLISAICMGIALGLLGHDVWATALGGVALLDLIGAAVNRPLDQVNGALIRSEQIDMLLLSTHQRLREASRRPPVDREVAVQHVWASVLAELKTLEKR